LIDVFSLMFGRSPSFEKSLFTDKGPDTCEPCNSLMTQRTESEKAHFTTEDTSVLYCVTGKKLQTEFNKEEIRPVDILFGESLLYLVKFPHINRPL